MRNVGTKPENALGCAVEKVRQSADGGCAESYNGKMGDVERDGTGGCDSNGRKVSKLMQA